MIESQKYKIYPRCATPKRDFSDGCDFGDPTIVRDGCGLCDRSFFLDIDNPSKPPFEKGGLVAALLGGAFHRRTRANAIKRADYHCGLNRALGSPNGICWSL